MNTSASIQERLCAAFCGELTVHKIPIGYAVGTGFQGMDDDLVGFYVQGPNESGKYRLIDDALLVPTLESLGAEVKSNASRREAFHGLMESHGVQFIDGTGELLTEYISESELPGRALKFLSFMLRVQDLAFMSQERAASTFKEDATRKIREAVKGHAEFVSNEFIVHERLSEWPADLGIIPKDRPPVAVFLSQTDAHVFEALLLQVWAMNQKIDCVVVVLLEANNSVSIRTLTRANNHLDTTAIFRGHETDAINRIIREALSTYPNSVH